MSVQCECDEHCVCVSSFIIHSHLKLMDSCLVISRRLWAFPRMKQCLYVVDDFFHTRGSSEGLNSIAKLYIVIKKAKTKDCLEAFLAHVLHNCRHGHLHISEFNTDNLRKCLVDLVLMKWRFVGYFLRAMVKHKFPSDDHAVMSKYFKDCDTTTTALDHQCYSIREI